jgi:integrase
MATIRKVPSGAWQAIVRIKGHAQQSETFRTKAMAQTWATKTEAAMREGRHRDTRVAEALSVSDCLAWYLTTITAAKSASAVKREASRAKILSEAFPDRTLADLTPQHVIDFVRSRSDLAPASIKRDLSVFGHAIDAAVALRNVTLPGPNPVKEALTRLRFTKTLRINDARDRRLQPGEWERLLDALKDAPLARAAVIILLETGMRREELTSAKRDQLNRSVLSVTHKTQHLTGKPRKVPLSPLAQETIRGLPIRRDGFIVGVRPDSLTQAFSRACERAGIEGLRLHDLRHECASRLFEAGWSIEPVAVVTGHSDWRSLARYTNLQASDIAEKLAG